MYPKLFKLLNTYGLMIGIGVLVCLWVFHTYAKKKKLSDGSESINVYLVQNENSMIDIKELIKEIDAFALSLNIKIDGYKELYSSLPIDPTTLKPRNKDLDGFIKCKNGKVYDVSYEEVETDIYTKYETEVITKKIAI